MSDQTGVRFVMGLPEQQEAENRTHAITIPRKNPQNNEPHDKIWERLLNTEESKEFLDGEVRKAANFVGKNQVE